LNPATALVRTKKAKEGACVSAGARVPIDKQKAATEDTANKLFECRDDDNVTESIGETTVSLASRESTPKASKILFLTPAVAIIATQMLKR
jgi:hypothetical protein